MAYEEFKIEGRNPVMEAFRSGKTIDKVFILDGCEDGPVKSIVRAAKKQDTYIRFVKKRTAGPAFGNPSASGGVIAIAAAYTYSTVEDILAAAREKGEDPFVFILDGIEDPHNLGAIIRTGQSGRGSHGVILHSETPGSGADRHCGKTSAGALNYTPVAKVANIGQTIDALKKRGTLVCLWSYGRRRDVSSESERGRLALLWAMKGWRQPPCPGKMRLHCIDSDEGRYRFSERLVAAGVLAYEIVRQRMN